MLGKYNSPISLDIFFFFFLPLCRRNTLEWEEELNLASFLGEQLRHLHLLPHPPHSSNSSDVERDLEFHHTNGYIETAPDKSNRPAEWDIFVNTLNRKKKDLSSRLTKWYFYLSTLGDYTTE